MQLRRTVISKSIDKQPEIEGDNIISLRMCQVLLQGTRTPGFIVAISIYRVTSSTLRPSCRKQSETLTQMCPLFFIRFLTISTLPQHRLDRTPRLAIASVVDLKDEFLRFQMEDESAHFEDKILSRRLFTKGALKDPFTHLLEAIMVSFFIRLIFQVPLIYTREIFRVNFYYNFIIFF